MSIPNPGINRDNRISKDGLQRLDKQLKAGRRPSQQVLKQWVKRHGEAAQKIIDLYTPQNNDKIKP